MLHKFCTLYSIMLATKKIIYNFVTFIFHLNYKIIILKLFLMKIEREAIKLPILSPTLNMPCEICLGAPFICGSFRMSSSWI